MQPTQQVGAGGPEVGRNDGCGDDIRITDDLRASLTVGDVLDFKPVYRDLLELWARKEDFVTPALPQAIHQVLTPFDECDLPTRAVSQLADVTTPRGACTDDDDLGFLG